MGKKSKAAKLRATAHVDKDSSPNLETEIDKLEPEMPKRSAAKSTGTKASKDKSMIARRSGRLQNLVRPTRSQECEHVIEEINLVESEREDEPRVEECIRELHVDSGERKYEPHVETRIREPHIQSHSHDPVLNEKSLEEKVDYLVQTANEFKSKGIKRCFSSDSTSTDFNYKSLYIDSQKKLEALTDENQQLGKKLEIALAKLEVHENIKEVMEKLKDVILISNLTKATEGLVNLSSKAVLGKFSSPGVAVEPETVVATDISPTKKKRRGKKD